MCNNKTVNRNSKFLFGSITLLFIIVLFSGASCKHSIQNSPEITPKKEEPKPNEMNIAMNDTMITITDRDKEVKFFIRIPKNKPVKGLLMALHGWNLPALDWCTKTSLCDKALDKGYIVVLPEMGKSTYSYRLYPETREDWLEYPTRKWLIDTAFTYLQTEFGILKKGQNNFVLGLSTGARGALLLALDCPEIFRACASLSGDCDQTKMPQEPIYIGFYGQYQQFPLRWEGQDNIYNRVPELKMPVYLGHGLKDNISPPEQTQMLYDAIQDKLPNLTVTLNMDSTAQHNYKYWDSEVDNMLAFFEATIK